MEGLFADGDSIYFLLVVIVAVLWIFLPFAILGAKDRLDHLIAETCKTNKLLEEILDEVSRSALNLASSQPQVLTAGATLHRTRVTLPRILPPLLLQRV
jgi:hypothetical protein